MLSDSVAVCRLWAQRNHCLIAFDERKMSLYNSHFSHYLRYLDCAQLDVAIWWVATWRWWVHNHHCPHQYSQCFTNTKSHGSIFSWSHRDETSRRKKTEKGWRVSIGTNRRNELLLAPDRFRLTSKRMMFLWLNRTSHSFIRMTCDRPYLSC